MVHLACCGMFSVLLLLCAAQNVGSSRPLYCSNSPRLLRMSLIKSVQPRCHNILTRIVALIYLPIISCILCLKCRFRTWCVCVRALLFIMPPRPVACSSVILPPSEHEQLSDSYRPNGQTNDFIINTSKPERREMPRYKTQSRGLVSPRVRAKPLAPKRSGSRDRR